MWYCMNARLPSENEVVKRMGAYERKFRRYIYGT